MKRQLISMFIILIMVPFLTLLAFQAYPATLEVDDLYSLPISQGGLGIHNMLDIDALGRDTTLLICAWVHGPNGWSYFGRSAADYSVGVAAGADDLRGSPFGDTLLARYYDGVTDYDTVLTTNEDSLEWQSGGIWYEILLKRDDRATNFLINLGKFAALGNNGFLVCQNDATDGKIRAKVGDGTIGHNIAIASTGTYNDALYHVIRWQLTDIEAILAIDDDTPDTTTYASTGLVIADASTSNPLHIGGNVSGAQLSEINTAYIGLYAGEPTVTIRDTFYNYIKNHLDTDSVFASIQTAIDYSSADDVISVAEDYYPEPIVIPAWDLTIRGDDPQTVEISGGGILPDTIKFSWTQRP